MMIPWEVPLGAPPRPWRLGLGIHGSVPEESYLLPGIWCLHAYRYACDLTIAGEDIAIRPGDITLIAPDVPMRYRFPRGDRRHLYALFALEGSAGDRMPIACHHRLSRRDHHSFEERFRACVEEQSLGHSRTTAGVWELLWRLAGQQERADTTPVDEAAKLIDAALAGDLAVTRLAAEVGVSADHLTRLFQERFGTTVVGHIRERRLALARDLLEQTDLPVARIARDCGIPDLQYFNKQVRSRWGASPRALRAGRGE